MPRSFSAAAISRNVVTALARSSLIVGARSDRPRDCARFTDLPANLSRRATVQTPSRRCRHGSWIVTPSFYRRRAACQYSVGAQMLRSAQTARCNCLPRHSCLTRTISLSCRVSRPTVRPGGVEAIPPLDPAPPSLPSVEGVTPLQRITKIRKSGAETFYRMRQDLLS